MTYSNRGGNDFGGGNYPKRNFNDRGSDREMFDATCAQCGAACKVPFRPNGRKEVFCSKCFETNGGGSRESNYGAPRSPGMFDKRDAGSSNFSYRSFGQSQDRQMFGATCDQCGERCEVPFRPTNGKPVLCSNCFAGKDDRGGRSNTNSFSRNTSPFTTSPKAQDSSRELEAINAKLDKILKLLSPIESKTTREDSSEENKKVAKEITSKILEEIEMTSGQKVETGKKKVKVTSKKKSV